MKKNKLAVVLVGSQNSGKTTTIKAFDEQYGEVKGKTYCKAGRRYLQLHKLKALYTYIFFVPASPTETNYSLEKRLNKINPVKPRPEMILMAEQLKGHAYDSTIKFLKSEGYHIEEIIIGHGGSTIPWKRWDASNKNLLLKNRANEIADIFREFIEKQTK